MKKASKSFGDDFDCQKDWPEDCYVQCGGSGIVFKSSPEDGSYFTAFFEAFPKNPKTFIRGEGASIEEAEANAWDKFQRILACDKHEYKRHGEEHGICIKCGLFTSEVFSPSESCSVCNKPEVNYHICFSSEKHSSRPVCRDHYIQQIPYMESFSKESIDNLEYMDRQYYSYELKNMRITKYFLDNKIIDTSLPEYIEANRVDSISTEFYRFVHNSLHSVIKVIDENREEDNKLRYKLLEFIRVKENIVTNKDYLYLLLDYYFEKKKFEYLVEVLSQPIIEMHSQVVKNRLK